MRLTSSIDIQAPPDTVWAVWSDLERWPEWTASVSRVERIEPGPLAIGLRARVHQPKFPPATWRVIALEEGQGFTWVSESPGARVTASHWIEPHAGGLATSYAEWGFGIADMIGNEAPLDSVVEYLGVLEEQLGVERSSSARRLTLAERLYAVVLAAYG